MKDKLSIAKLIVKGLPRKSEYTDSPEQKMGEEQSDEQMAAQEILEAIKEEDLGALVDALKGFIKMCSYDTEEDAEEEE